MRHKFSAKRTERAGHSFASKGEAELFDFLFLKEKAGEISNLKTQVCVYLTDARVMYKPDFQYTENGETVWAEFKGFEVPSWRIKRKLWMYYGPGKLLVFKKKSRLFLSETIIPKTKKLAG